MTTDRTPLTDLANGAPLRSGDAEFHGLVHLFNRSLAGDLHLEAGQAYGRAQKPKDSQLSDDAFAEIAKDRSLIGIYGPPKVK